MHTRLAPDASLDCIVAVDLKNAARAALELGDAVDFYLHPSGVPGCLMVETLVVGDRAGQVTNGNAVWGDWDEEAKTLRLDEFSSEGHVLLAGLDGQQRPVPGAPPVCVTATVEGGTDAVPEGVTFRPYLSGAELKLATLNDTDLFAETLVLLAGYPDTRAVLMLADAEWKRRGDARFLAAMHAKGEAREATRAELELGNGAAHLSGPHE